MMFVRPKTVLKLVPIALLASGMLAATPASADELIPPRALTEYEQELIQDATQEEKEMLFRAIALNEEVNRQQHGTLGSFRSAPKDYIDKFDPNKLKQWGEEGVKCGLYANPINCYTGFIDSKTARDTAVELYPEESLHNGEGDAFRHCYWNALMYLHFGNPDAETIANNHESVADGPEEETAMDLHNNAVGREIGRRVGTEDDAKQGCQDAVGSGELQVIG
ncbi:MAG: hypothetical protein Q4A03_04405 [Rothia sp. (in: high G+C Gram-positive bacteria)]|uniref:DUF6973 domain-containing protein n=1 Tax=Rothia sp. (in: high G+C Gram-positive bacteria) TaxID=1885016 RepID=UPI00270B4AF0|nr:hypothetical protein [Rothia sp. (in: high G+C Gram-positive bacteria)]